MNPAVVIPVYKSNLSPFESISFEQCRKVLGNYPIIVAGPDDIPYDAYASFENIRIVEFPAEYFKSIAAYNRLLVHPEFYQRFAEYSHILIHQLDAFVFRDNLDYWCRQGFSYIGAPWFENFETGPQAKTLWAVGNGGFSLRRIEDHLAVLKSRDRVLKFEQVLELYKDYSLIAKISRSPKMIARALGYRNRVEYIPEIFGENEDRFWSFYAVNLYGDFKVAPVDKALKFSFECNPAVKYKLNGHKLPFGCHAWEKYDPAFWRPFITSFGYSV